MTKLIVSSASGWGKCVNKNGTTFTVLRAEGRYNLLVQFAGRHEFSFWAKENVKRVSTLQKWLNEREYDVQIELY